MQIIELISEAKLSFGFANGSGLGAVLLALVLIAIAWRVPRGMLVRVIGAVRKGQK
ncbi:hypothetical protein [Celeribacter ethanolicus]|uniref:hypothetical protein n=1 Tax=Celeribacter ethanolicus TaxID=1758178 RepID=UPI0012DD6A3D|nr:hypothetical protein [Celeribacter ethanolicus]